MTNRYNIVLIILFTIAIYLPASAQGGYSISENGLDFIAEHEGIRYNLYNDPAGHCTIGIGHLVHKGNCDGSDASEQEFLDGITRDQAFELLMSDVSVAERAVNTYVTVPLTQSQFDALVSFAYNVGSGNFKNSDLVTKLNKGEYDAVPGELNKWVYSSGKVLPGLVRRRSDEGELFQSEGLATGSSRRVILTLYVNNGSASGPGISDALVIGHDGSGNRFRDTTDSNGVVTITGDSGTWSFKASADGYETNSWDQEIANTCTKHAFLQKSLGGINFTSIKLNYISVTENSTRGINFDYIFKAQKAEGSSHGIDLNDSMNLGFIAFKTGLAVHNYHLWVNLAPWDPDRIIDDQINQSDVGRIMLEADLQMKKDLSKYWNPCANETGKACHDLLDKKHKALAQRCTEKFPGEIKNIDNIKFYAVTRQEILPDKVYAYTNGTQIYIINASLTIDTSPILDHSYFKVVNQDNSTLSKGCLEELNRSLREYCEYNLELNKQKILPYVIAEVNHEEKYEDLREVYVALALAQWYLSHVSPSMDIFQRNDSFNILKSQKPWSPIDIWRQFIDIYNKGDYICWKNTTNGDRTMSRSYSGGGCRFQSITDHLVEINEMPPEVQDQVKRTLSEGVIKDDGETLFGKRLYGDIRRPSLISSSSSVSRSNPIEPAEKTHEQKAPVNTSSQGQIKHWEKTFGGGGDDLSSFVSQTSDDGYIIVGKTSSYGSGYDDIWLVKTDSLGNEIWDKTFGGPNNDYPGSVQQTKDDGYVIAGTTVSYGGPCLIKTDSSGNMEWDKIFSGGDEAKSVRQTSDGGYIIAGKNSLNGECGWLVKTDSSGNRIWDKTVGADLNGCRLSSVQITKDGGYILAGIDYYSGLLLYKTDNQGNTQWNKTLGGASDYWGLMSDPEVQLTDDGGYIIAFIMPEGEKDNRMLESAWLIKVNSAGDKEWDKIFKDEGSTYSRANSVQQTSDGGYIVSGRIIQSGKGSTNAWLIKTDSSGNKEWERIFSGGDMAKSVRQTSDGGYIIAGDTWYNKTNKNDFWLEKIGSDGDDGRQEDAR